MSRNSSIDVVNRFLSGFPRGTVADECIDPNLTYISLNHDNPELAQTMPWTGTHFGSAVLKKSVAQLLEVWDFHEFKVDTVFGEGEQVAVFDRFTYESKKVKRITKSPFAIYLKVKDGKIVHLQFFEDTYSTAASFRRSGHWEIENAAGPHTVGD
jgi:ketosteroid isomerase-like protein